jgi:hypothetical protein
MINRDYKDKRGIGKWVPLYTVPVIKIRKGKSQHDITKRQNYIKTPIIIFFPKHDGQLETTCSSEVQGAREYGGQTIRRMLSETQR